MRLTGLIPELLDDAALASAVRSAANGRSERTLSIPLGARAPLIAAMLGADGADGADGGDDDAGGADRLLVVVTATGREADETALALRHFLNEDEVAVLPAWETLPHERLSPRSDTVARRIAVFRRLAHPDPAQGRSGRIRVLVMPVRSLLQPVVAGLGDLEPVALRVGDERPMEDVVAALQAAAYTRVDMVGGRGEFAVRGGILDVFAPTDAHPTRIEFWGDEVDEIRPFAVADQRSIDGETTELWAPPARELLLDDAVRRRSAELIAELPGAAEMLEKMSQGIAVEGMESLAPLLVEDMVPVAGLLPPGALVMLSEPERIRRRAHDLVATTEEFLAAAWTAAASGGSTPLDLSAASFATLPDTRELARSRGLGWWALTSLSGDAPTVAARDVVPYRGDIPKALAELRELSAAGWRLVITTAGHGSARRMVEQLAEADVPARLVDDVEATPPAGVVVVTTAQVPRGFVAADLKLALVTESDITGRAGATTRDMRRMPARRRGGVDPLELRPGDYVVHEQHGVGRFVELVQRTVGSGQAAATREYLVIEYASSKRGQPGDRLFVPTDALDQVTKYTGGEAPSVNKMGGADWAKTKSRARRAVREIAAELIRLYAARSATKGHAFGPDTPWQQELEDAFEHIETPDQVVTIDEVKADMEKPTPMDRLISGDVGYGKTEIAIRAAFKAVQDGKQVAVLVPTTLLVQQHFDTFSERYAGFPITVKPLSRFQTDAEANAVVAGLTDGSVDVVIGTHRLLTGEVRFKDLGLVIIDEEQRFGVEHKETLKQLRTNVDVLAMSATPIPRTL
ncbi:MAG TPA: DEAD/DEAH box helicase, partial [Actinomycetaceae bacterium]|nr:DEAD/DEAH box helicase [Actinomycetaceae bacterium]